MKSTLYAVWIDGRWQWQCSIDFQTDLFYWFGHYGAETGIVQLEPLLSLGQAQILRDQFMQHTPRKWHTSTVTQQERISPNHTQELLTIIQTVSIANKINRELCDTFRLQHYVFDTSFPLSAVNERTNPEIFEQMLGAFNGRSLLIEEIGQLVENLNLPLSSHEWLSYVQLAYLRGDVEITNGLLVEERRGLRSFWRKTKTYSCKRCGSGSERMYWSSCVFCGGDCPYCEECLTMGRTRFCSLLVHGKAGRGMKREGYSLTNADDFVTSWGLSEAQSAASEEGLRFLEGKPVEEGSGRVPRSFLIWAVTGAGKTEMIFPFIQYELARGGRVLIATPRKDVVLELRPRITKAFAGNSVVTLYGGSEQRWERGDIKLATTHQLMRFREAFDLVIIDEIDAFPYHNNPVLEYAAKKVCKPNGNYILLSATPPPKVRKSAERGILPHVKVPVRFHRHPLPVPEWVEAPYVRQMLQADSIPAALLRKIQFSVDRGAQVFIFAANIQLVDPLATLLRKKLRFEWNGSDDCYVEGTSSKDPFRTDKVQRFREKLSRVLVTTTILERGVTIPKSDVYILDADSRLFDEAALVQMAGRAGRSKDDPAGKVYFIAKERTQSQSEAIRQIKRMNRLARKRGYFKGGHS